MTHRRSFIKKSLSAAAAFSLPSLTSKAIAEDVSEALLDLNKLSVLQSAQDEDLWNRISQGFTVSANLINLNNAGVSPQPKIVQDAVIRYYEFCNEAPSHYMWHVLDKGKDMLKNNLADMAGISDETLALTRNTTESLGIVTYGLTLNKGDEIVMTRQDYPNMIQAWKQREMREGIKINWINFKLPIENEDFIINSYIEATTPKTKVWHISHMINWTGQILPARRLCEEARKRNIISIVDGAQTFGQLDYKIPDINPDYYGTSLHKWLCAPFGTGILYIKKEHIGGLWPLFPNENPRSEDIRKFEVTGTRFSPADLAIGHAINFHTAIGAKRKEERLRFLKNYWCEKLSKHPRIKINVSLKPEFACALGHFNIEGMDTIKVNSTLFFDYQIHTTTMVCENVNGIRVSPNVYTSTKDLDQFVEAVLKIAAS